MTGALRPPRPSPEEPPMAETRPSLAVRSLRGLWLAVDGARRFTVNLLFVLLVGLVAAFLLDRGPKVPEKAALVLAPAGTLVEQRSADPSDRALGELTGEPVREALMRDLLAGIRAAQDDDRIAALLLDLDGLSGSGMSKLRDLKAALAEFKASGKKVIAAADSYEQAAYYLAAQADEIHLSPQGLVLLTGFGRFRHYYKEGLDKYGIDAHVFRVGEYKSAVEPWLRDGPSPEAREADLDVLGDLWRAWLDDVGAGRGRSASEIAAYVDRMDERLLAAGGDAARAALEAGLVDRLSNRDEVRARLIELVGEDEESHDFHQIALADYLEAKDLTVPPAARGDAVGVVLARGTILDGAQSAGKVGGDSTSALVRKAREDESIKAIVLRVDSPGGSAFASELIRRELALARTAGKPVVVSMGSVAASGGYWISTASDEIWADPTTITGSIGIFGVIPTFEKPLANYLGVHADGTGTTWLTGALRADRALEPRLGGMVQGLIDRGYEEFLARVAEARKMTRDEVDAIGRGRVWSGADAKGIGLVDQLGGLDAAIASAGRLAKLGETPKVRWIEKERTWSQRLADRLFETAARLAPAEGAAARGPLAAG
ncbi:MAG: signal peptide peptidase SppA, partial [Thermoanaerobaculia bacterium]